MLCPNCDKEQPPARYCIACGERMVFPSNIPDPLDQVPEAPGIPGEARAKGQFALGRDTAEEPVLEPSEWTVPMRLTVAGWIAFSGVIDTYAVFQLQDAIRQAAYPSSQVIAGTVTASAALASARFAFDVVLGMLVVLLLVKALLAVGAYGGRTAWVFFACLVLVGLTALLGLGSLALIFIDLGHHSDPTAFTVLLLVQATAAGLFGWMVLGLRRYGPWAARRVSPGP